MSPLTQRNTERTTAQRQTSTGRRSTWIYGVVSALLLWSHTGAGAQSYDPAVQSPLNLLTAPPDPVAYFDARQRARALLGEGKLAEAESLIEQITREYPRDGENWLALGYVRRALKKFPEAAAAYEKAGELLWWGGGNAGVGAAISHLHAGNRRAALDRLRHYTVAEARMATSWIYDEDDFVTLRSDPEFLEIAGRRDTSGWSRDYGWRRDLDFLRDEVRRLNAEYRNHPLPPELERRYEALREKVPQLSDEQIYVGMNGMLAVLNQGHTSVRALSNSRVVNKGLPFQLWAFPEGIFIVSARERHEDLIGSRLVSIEGVSADEALRRVNQNQSVDGDNEYLYAGIQTLRDAPYLVGLGIARSADSIELTVQPPGQPQQKITVETTSWRAPDRLQPLRGIETPLYLREHLQFHWHQALPEHDALYVQLNNLQDERDETVEEYALRLRSLIAASPPKNLILDMRHNDGGSTHLYAEFLRTMIAFSMLPDRRLYVVIGRNTYSAAGNLITELEQLADAIFVGEASSECCTFYGSPSEFTLPFSGLAGSMSTRRWSLSRKGDDFRRELHPHAPVLITARDYFSGRDPVMETVVRLIEREKARG
ncbi:MAG TPA: hypothetical protein VHG93_21390 [Longimicrobium sp.]|nr:hypothetical protein [Longimicrobium sp.]